jgi:NitT/TauT family transport system ATP-binding protein
MMSSDGSLTIQGVTHWFVASDADADDLCVLDDVSIDVPAGQFLAIVGASGCGKTTLLNMMAGLLRASRGKVERGGVDAMAPSRDIGYMVANSGLLPWRKAVRNVELGLEYRKLGKRERRESAERFLSMVGLGDFTDSYPNQLSHGMKQRVSLARTLVVDPTFLFMDEPFAALDAQTKMLVQSEFVSIWEGRSKTVVFVTHDLEEAVALADRVIVMSSRPGTVKADIEIDLPRPRVLGDIRFAPRFRELSERVWAALRDEMVMVDG